LVLRVDVQQIRETLLNLMKLFWILRTKNRTRVYRQGNFSKIIIIKTIRMSFAGQVAIITGGAQGIGFGIAKYVLLFMMYFNE